MDVDKILYGGDDIELDLDALFLSRSFNRS
jgi:hypothetical protein